MTVSDPIPRSLQRRKLPCQGCLKTLAEYTKLNEGLLDHTSLNEACFNCVRGDGLALSCSKCVENSQNCVPVDGLMRIYGYHMMREIRRHRIQEGTFRKFQYLVRCISAFTDIFGHVPTSAKKALETFLEANLDSENSETLVEDNDESSNNPHDYDQHPQLNDVSHHATHTAEDSDEPENLYTTGVENAFYATDSRNAHTTPKLCGAEPVNGCERADPDDEVSYREWKLRILERTAYATEKNTMYLRRLLDAYETVHAKDLFRINIPVTTRVERESSHINNAIEGNRVNGYEVQDKDKAKEPAAAADGMELSNHIGTETGTESYGAADYREKGKEKEHSGNNVSGDGTNGGNYTGAQRRLGTNGVADYEEKGNEEQLNGNGINGNSNVGMEKGEKANGVNENEVKVEKRLPIVIVDGTSKRILERPRGRSQT
ncbi:hypothetical protein F5Y18DRAFT_28704 [Xylariaceae sp. FL1019]|nr:hypothetical protein F5Y18DRAFT_28704 [Xylariaceae sp. FL1019]